MSANLVMNNSWTVLQRIIQIRIDLFKTSWPNGFKSAFVYSVFRSAFHPETSHKSEEDAFPAGCVTYRNIRLHKNNSLLSPTSHLKKKSTWPLRRLRHGLFLWAQIRGGGRLQCVLCNLYTRDEPDLSTIWNRPEYNSSTFYSSRVRKSTHHLSEI